MAAYGALLSLSHTLHQILNPPPLNTIIVDTQQIEFLSGKVNLMINFLETYHLSRRSQEIEDVETKIADVAYEAEDIIESNVVDQILGEDISTLLCEGLRTVLDKFLSVEKELMKMKVVQGSFEDPPPKSFSIAASSRQPLPDGKITLVGLKEHTIQIMGALATDESDRQIIPIVGMGGIGKTTLASAVYNNPFIVEYFHIRAWVTVSQEYTVQVVLLRLLSGIAKVDQNKKENTEYEIGELLHKILFGRKYLIVMDDMWDIEVWDRVKRFLPNNGNGSRILVTTRLSSLADDFGSCSPHQIGLLDEEKSWDLLREKVFGKEECSSELVEIGKNIAEKCGGLPLALVVIGGILAKSERTNEHWRFVERDVTWTKKYENGDEQMMEILSLSYSHLPMHLKPCFLYMAVFPEDFEIHVSWLIRLWVAEGLIKPTQDKCLEEVAREHIDNLISRNLIFVSKRSRSGKVKCCKIHDILRDLSIAQAEKENFIYIAKLDNPKISPHMKTKRRLSVSCPSKLAKLTAVEALGSAKLNRSWLSHGSWWRRREGENSDAETLIKTMVVNQIHGFRLLKVAHVDDYIKLTRYGKTELQYVLARHGRSVSGISLDILELINLRYVVSRSASSISSMALCWNLQTLVLFDISIILPVEIWRMPQLRHIKSDSITLSDPSPDDQDVIVLKNLQTLETISSFACTAQVLERIPNLRKLRISYSLSAAAEELVPNYCLRNLACLKKLESLDIYGAVCTNMAFPVSLKKLSLTNCKIPWEDLSVVGWLPNLEVLNLYYDATKGEEWNPIEGQFCRLKFLMIYAMYLKIWGAVNYHFPCLERLVPGGVIGLQEIPMSFAEILTLEEIELDLVNDSVRSSARDISEQREQLGYEPLQILDYVQWDFYGCNWHPGSHDSSSDLDSYDDPWDPDWE